jgi:hypothetical protein
MTHASNCRAAADALAGVADAFRPDVVVGFDGFIDYIIDVVATRTDTTSYTSIPTIADFGRRISEAAGKSANFELVVKKSKIGGNGPIMANALCSYQYGVTAIGLLGAGAIDPVFAPLAERAKRTISLGAAASTDALEFSDGKLMLGKLLPMETVTYDNLLKATGGVSGLKNLLKDAPGVATVNWTMTLGMTKIWTAIAKDVLPGLRTSRGKWFIDLADPAKRTVGDITAALDAMKALQVHTDVVLGLNEMECRQILGVLGLSWPAITPEWEAAREACVKIRAHLGLSRVMCHLVRSAAEASVESSHGVDGFFDPKPMITTGAGDHFNAGYFAALLAGLPPRDALMIGGATSGHYVRTAVSPSRQQVIEFLRARS